VYRAIHKETLTEVAIKILKASKNDMANIEKEAKILQNCKHENIVNYYGIQLLIVNNIIRMY
jgi:serine/threonine protein kinase